MKRIMSLLLALAMLFTLALSANFCAYAELPSVIPDPTPDDPPAPFNPYAPVDPGDTPANPQPEDPGNTPVTPQPENPGNTPVTPQPENPGDTPVNPQPENPGDTPINPQPTDPIYTPPVNYPTDPPVVPIQPIWGTPVVTKNPTDETVVEGGYAEFIARADSYTKINWYICGSSGMPQLTARFAPDDFPGLEVTGLNTPVLGLDHIPLEMDGWRIRAEFVGNNGSTWTEYATLTVTERHLAAPVVTEHPQSASMKEGENTVLSVAVITSERDVELSYHWFKNTVNSSRGGRAIPGATEETYVPEYMPGTTYYYCAVRVVAGEKESEAALSECAAITYAQPTQPTAAPTVPEATASATTPTTPTDSVTTAPTQAPTVPLHNNGFTPTRSNTLMVIVVIAIVAVAILGIIVTVVMLQFYPGRKRYAAEEEDYEEEPEEYEETSDDFNVFETEEDIWDDLSDLGDLSIYLDDDEL